MNKEVGQANLKEIKESIRKCWNSDCKKISHFEYIGWRHCFKHWWTSFRWGGGEVSLKAFWNYCKWTKIINWYK